MMASADFPRGAAESGGAAAQPTSAKAATRGSARAPGEVRERIERVMLGRPALGVDVAEISPLAGIPAGARAEPRVDAPAPAHTVVEASRIAGLRRGVL